MASAPRIELNSRSPEAIDGRQIRALAFHDVRMEYVRRTLGDLGFAAEGRRALVVGSGRGPLARGLAHQGFEVTAVDPSPEATQMAREASDREGVGIVHEVARAEELELAGRTFDVAYYADTFEITSALDRVLAGAARALGRDGLLFYDTVNRTLLSRLVYLGAFQGVPATRIVPRGRYAANRLRTPRELAEALGRHGFDNADICGFKPKDPRKLLTAVRALRRGEISAEEVPPVVDMVLEPTGPPLVTYLGYARKV